MLLGRRSRHPSRSNRTRRRLTVRGRYIRRQPRRRPGHYRNVQPTAPRGRKITRLSVSPRSSLARRKSRPRVRRSRRGAPHSRYAAVSAIGPSSWVSLDPHDLSQCDKGQLRARVAADSLVLAAIRTKSALSLGRVDILERIAAAREAASEDRPVPPYCYPLNRALPRFVWPDVGPRRRRADR
jgi:hypothetical protein